MYRCWTIYKLLSATCTGMGLSAVVLALALMSSRTFANDNSQVNAQCNLCVGNCLATRNGACLAKACNAPPIPPAPVGACSDCSCTSDDMGDFCVCIQKASPEDP